LVSPEVGSAEFFNKQTYYFDETLISFHQVNHYMSLHNRHIKSQQETHIAFLRYMTTRTVNTRIACFSATLDLVGGFSWLRAAGAWPGANAQGGRERQARRRAPRPARLGHLGRPPSGTWCSQADA